MEVVAICFVWDIVEGDSIASFFRLLLSDSALPRSTVPWVAYAFTKQLALQDVRSVIPVSKDEEAARSPRSLPPLLSLLLDTVRPDETDCRLMLLVVRECFSGQSLDLASFLSANHLTLETCLQYVREEAAALQALQSVESMESSQSSQSIQSTQPLDVRAWEWGIAWCIGVLGGLPNAIAVNVLSSVHSLRISHRQLESQCEAKNASLDSTSRLRLAHTLHLLVSLVTQTQLLLDSSSSESFFASTMELEATPLMNAMLLSGLTCRDATFLSQVPLILSKNGRLARAASLLVRLVVERPNDRSSAVACLTVIEEGVHPTSVSPLVVRSCRQRVKGTELSLLFELTSLLPVSMTARLHRRLGSRRTPTARRRARSSRPTADCC